MGVAGEGVRQVSRGRLPSAGEMLLTPGNAARLTERLSELRGAAMKVGQLLSMEAGDLIPPALSDILARLRDDAHRMPLGEVAKVLEYAWGAEWPSRFERFNFTPMAAASIGQVHEARDRSGRHLAIKLQYPGIRQSIDSDVDSVAALLGLFRALPDRAQFEPLFAEAKQQLHVEADYRAEASYATDFGRFLGKDPDFYVPEIVDDWTTPEVLVMSFVRGDSIDTVAADERSVRDRVAAAMVRLALTELFEWGLVQTDPNFANFRIERDTGRIGLLDFGAVRRYEVTRVNDLRRLFTAAIAADTVALEGAAIDAGYLDTDAPQDYRNDVVGLLIDASEPVRHEGAYDFANSDLSTRMTERLVAMRLEGRNWRFPPTDILFLHRKLGGLYMLCQRLRARINVAAIVNVHLGSHA